MIQKKKLNNQLYLQPDNSNSDIELDQRNAQLRDT